MMESAATDMDHSAAHARALAGLLESLYRAGVTHITRPQPAKAADRPVAHQAALAPVPSSQAAAMSELADDADDAPSATSPVIQPEDRASALEVIRLEVSGCARCEELARTRTQTVFGVGNPGAKLCFMGEAPGADEDRQGEPFVGRAGQLLTKIIQACTLSRDDVYILNTLKCRPPGNRNPLSEEVENCRGFLDRQLQVIRPEFICCLGAVAAKALLSTETSIGKLRGRFHDYRGIRVLCTYHPAYLLRNPSAKRQVWEDMQMLMAEMGVKLPGA